MTHTLFVYGTLAPGESNAHILKPLAGSWVPGSVRGKLFAEGWGAAQGFPAIVLNSTAERVDGLVFSSEELAEHWARLDEFEGEGYERVLTPVSLASGETIEAYIYVLSGFSAD